MSPGRWELLRAVGAMTVVAPPASDGIASSLGIGPVSAASFTDTFVLSLPPYAGIHLGPEGKLGGEGADRVAGMWRALGLAPPADADHLGSLLLLYAELGEAGEHTAGPRAALLWEHLWSWAPGYLSAVSSCSSGGLGEWADLALRVLIREITLARGALDLPLALRAAPDSLNPDDDLESVLDALTAPVRTGFILTYGDLRSAAHTLGLGLRRGERRFAVKAMMEQDPPGTLAWLSDHARAWAALHRRRPVVAHDPGPWWEQRALRSSSVLGQLSQAMAAAFDLGIGGDQCRSM